MRGNTITQGILFLTSFTLLDFLEMTFILFYERINVQLSELPCWIPGTTF